MSDSETLSFEKFNLNQTIFNVINHVLCILEEGALVVFQLIYLIQTLMYRNKADSLKGFSSLIFLWVFLVLFANLVNNFSFNIFEIQSRLSHYRQGENPFIELETRW